MSLTISDVLYSLAADGTTKPVPRANVTASPVTTPFSLKSGVLYNFIPSPAPSVQTDINGNWTLVLPWPSESNPNTEQWQIAFPDGTVFQGTVPEGQTGPYSLWVMRNTYGWTAVQLPAVAQANPFIYSGVPAATANYGLFNIGPGPFDGVSTGKFVGSGNGAILAVNAGQGFAGRLVDFQTYGLSRFLVDYAGNTQTGGTSYAAHFSSSVVPTVDQVNAGISSASVAGTDHGGVISLTTGGSAVAAGAQLLRVNFAQPFGQIPGIVVCVSSGAPAGGGVWYVATLTVSSFNLYATGNLGVSSGFQVPYVVMR